MEQLAIVGAGGHAREVLGIVEAINAIAPRYDMLGWIVDSAYAATGTRVHDRPVLGDLAWLASRANAVRLICALGAPELRQRLAARAAALGARFTTVIHPQVVSSSRVACGDGVVIAAGSVLTTDIRCDAHVHVNAGCTIAHDCVLADFVTLSPGVHLAGGVVIDAGAMLGTGANVAPRVRIGAWSIIGAGCAVVDDVPPNTTVVGVPGRVVRQRPVGWQLATDEHR